MPLTKLAFVGMVRRNNTSGAAGVVWVRQRKKRVSSPLRLSEARVVRPPRGVESSVRSFAVNEYGAARAKALAIEARLQMGAQCDGFHAPHVPEASKPPASC